MMGFLGDCAKLRKSTISYVMSLRVCPSGWKNSALTGSISMKFGIWVFFENMLRKFKFLQNLTRIMATLYEEQYIFLITSRSFLLRMRNVSDKICRENQNTHFVFSIFFFRKSYRLWDNVEKYSRAGKATDDNMERVNFRLSTKGYKHALGIRNNRCLSTVTTVAR